MLRSRRVLFAAGLLAVLLPVGWILLSGRAAPPHTGPSSSPPSLSSAGTSEPSIHEGEPPLPSQEPPAIPQKGVRPPDHAIRQPPAAEVEGDPGGAGGEGLADILEPEGGELTDMLGHLQISCAAAAPVRGHTVALTAVSQCVEDAEGTMNLVDLLRGTIEGPAGAAMPAEVRTRWEGTLSGATATVRRMLPPVWDGVGHLLASGKESPAEFRTLGHLRDRIGRVLSAAGHP